MGIRYFIAGIVSNEEFVFSLKNSLVEMRLTFFHFSFIILLAHTRGEKNALVVVMMNGLTVDLLKELPALKDLQENGLTGKVNKFFPKDSAPISFTIATGLYPTEHGTVADYFYDHRDGELTMSNEAFFKYKEDIQPIWGYDGVRTACVDWPGCNQQNCTGNVSKSCRFSTNFIFNSLNRLTDDTQDSLANLKMRLKCYHKTKKI